MKLYAEKKNYKIFDGSMLDMADVVANNSIDAIICDPPYELNFMGKGWDNTGIAFQKETWQKCFNALKDGGYLLAFGGSRTFHRIACAIEDAGFEIRDTIMWLYGSGFPKSMNIGLALDKKNGIESEIVNTQNKGSSGFGNKHNGCFCDGQKDGLVVLRKATNEWAGWGTCLKPAYEPVIVARKPFKSSLVENIEKNRIGGLNIDECRVGTNGATKKNTTNCNSNNNVYGKGLNGGRVENINIGRFPANVIFTYDETDKEEVCGGMPNSKSAIRKVKESETLNKEGTVFESSGFKQRKEGGFVDSGSASRYFYCAKASKKDRDEGLQEFEEKQCFSALNTKNGSGERLDGGKTPIRKNTHPTVKPTTLMQYLVRLVAPKGATIMDCFMGSGSTGKAVMYENLERDANYKFVGIELTDEYLPIATARIDYVCNLKQENKQLSFFDMGE